MKVNSLKAKLKQITNLLPRKRVISVLEMNENSEPIIPEGVQISKGFLLVPRRNMTAPEWHEFFKAQEIAGIENRADIIFPERKPEYNYGSEKSENKSDIPEPINPWTSAMKGENVGVGNRSTEGKIMVQ